MPPFSIGVFMGDDTVVDLSHVAEHSGAESLGLALIKAGIKPMARIEAVDSPQFAKLLANLINSSYAFLLPSQPEQQVELIAAQPVTLDSEVWYLAIPYNTKGPLVSAGYYTVRDFVLSTTSDLMKIDNIGKVRAAEIRNIVIKAGFDMRDEKESYWDAVKRVYGSLQDAPIGTLFNGEIVIDNAKNRRLLGDLDSIGALSTWTRRQLNSISGDPAQSGRQELEAFLREHGLRVEMDAQEEIDKAEQFTLISPPTR